MHDVHSPPPMPPVARRSIKPKLWIGGAIAVLVLYFGVQDSVQASRAEKALAAFNASLATEDFKTAQQHLSDARDTGKKSAAVDLAQQSLKTAEARSEQYRQALALTQEKQWDKVIPLLSQLKSYKDSPALLQQVYYSGAQGAVAAGMWQDAVRLVDNLPDGYQDAGALRSRAKEGLTAVRYQGAVKAQQDKDYATAIDLFQSARDSGGQVPADLEKRVAAVRELKAQADAAAAKKAAQARLESTRTAQNQYTTGEVGIAVGGAQYRHDVGSHFATGDGTFVLVSVSVKNFELQSEHANPNNFTLSSPDGFTKPPDTETYGLNGYFNATDLGRGQSTDGWLVFYMPKAETYTVHYRSFRASAAKDIAPQ